MKWKHKIEVDGAICWFSEPGNYKDFIRARKRMEHFDKCALTNKNLDVEGGFLLVMSGFKLFPNCFANKEEVIKLGYEESIRRIADAWQEAQKFKHWFE